MAKRQLSGAQRARTIEHYIHSLPLSRGNPHVEDVTARMVIVRVMLEFSDAAGSTARDRKLAEATVAELKTRVEKAVAWEDREGTKRTWVQGEM